MALIITWRTAEHFIILSAFCMVSEHDFEDYNNYETPILSYQFAAHSHKLGVPYWK